MKSIKDNQVTVIFLSLLLMVSVFLLITEKEQFSQEIEDLKTHEKNLQGNIVKLQNTISKLESEKAVLESDNSQISDNLKQSNEIKKSYDYDVFLADLDNSDDTFEDLIDFFSLELGDGAIG